MWNVHNCHLKLENLKNVEQYQTKYSFELKLFLSHVDLENSTKLVYLLFLQCEIMSKSKRSLAIILLILQYLLTR